MRKKRKNKSLFFLLKLLPGFAFNKRHRLLPVLAAKKTKFENLLFFFHFVTRRHPDNTNTRTQFNTVAPWRTTV